MNRYDLIKLKTQLICLIRSVWVCFDHCKKLTDAKVFGAFI